MKTIEKLSRLKIEHLLSGHAYGNSGIITGVDEVRENFRYLLGF